MSHDGISANQPGSIWTRPVSLEFGKLAGALGKGAISGAFGNWPGVASSGLEAARALGLKGQGVGAIAWLLVERSLLQAMSDLIAPYQKDLTSEADFRQLCEQLDFALKEGNLALPPDFFERPKDLEILGLVAAPYRRWLQVHGLDEVEARAIAGRLPTHFVFALNEQWQSHPQEYAVLQEQLDTPFTKATERERAWLRYGAWLQRRVDEPMFDEKFSLRQIYVPLRAYYERSVKGEAAEETRLAEGREREQERVVVALEAQLLDWLNHAKVGDTTRVICGGPGSGKSSFSKVFAANLVLEQPTQKPLTVLFIPLHQFDPANDLKNAIDEFIQSDLDGILPPNPLERENAAERLLLIFDGLDELAMQGKIAAQVAQDFVKEVKGSLLKFNRSEVRVLALMSGREVVVQANQNEFRQEGQVLYVLPYMQPEAERKKYKYKYVDERDLLSYDQRQDWWCKYGRLKGLGYRGMPAELTQDNLSEITAQPLLNYLVALSYNRGELNFSEETNLNAVYADLLEQVYNRDWESYQHPELGNISKASFIRLLEEIAIACWHGNGRTTTVTQIEKRCSSKALKNILDVFEEEVQLRVTRLLTAFYFRQSDIQGGEATFEFTHKSFGEYLTARRIVREIGLIHQQFNQYYYDSDLGWDERECTKRWAILCGKTPLDEYLLIFLRDELLLNLKGTVCQWQQTLTDLVSNVIQHGMPMEKFDVRPGFLEEARQSRNAGETLLAALDGCARVTGKSCEINWKDRAEALGGWLMELRGQRISYDKNPIVLSCLKYLHMDSCVLIGGDFYKTDLGNAFLNKANLSSANFSNANLSSANLNSANLSSADLRNANLSNTSLRFADLYSANLSRADLRNASLSRANIRSADLRSIDLSNADLSNANLRNVDLRNAEVDSANLRSADLRSASLNNANFRGADLSNADLKNVDLRSANLNNTNLRSAALDSANLRRAYLSGTDFRRASLRRADLSNADVSRADLRNANLRDANLGSTDLRSADLSGGNLRSTYLRSACLSSAFLNGSDLSSADLRGADLSSAHLSNANFSRSNLEGADLRNADLSSANLSDTDLSGANLRNADLRNADLRGADLRGADLRRTDFSRAILLAADLRDHKYLIDKQQLGGSNSPLLCNISLSLKATDIHPNRDCDRIPQVLSDRYNIPLEEAQKIVDEACQKEWD